MGVINVSPESFYKGSVAQRREEIIARAEAMAKQGADFIDIGGKSTAPYLETEVPVEEEARRVVEAIRAIKENTSIRIPVSVDTTRAFVAEKAIEAGADIVNDVYGFKGDEKMASVVAEYGVPVIIGAHMDPVPENSSPIAVVLEALRESIEIARRHGVDEEKIVVDPAIGFFRPRNPPWYVWDSTILANLHVLRTFGKPILVGVSRKSFIGAITGRKSPEERLWGSLAATAIAVYNGAHIVRTHDPLETIDAIRVAEFIARHRITPFH
ncbi:dihydropteroate synthase [Pyrofollis japonicus]|uniref:dihydropteroate synthase n=1 Tax=Pyrofollis japonicus TaxID=3060460 RepID=UPI0037CA4CC2